MTSSLVGSEMCIRDRITQSISRQEWNIHPLYMTRRITALICVRAFPPVSYTHLTLPTICSV
eukprot:5291106-Prorocentrum_lima.AAC.1